MYNFFQYCSAYLDILGCFWIEETAFLGALGIFQRLHDAIEATETSKKECIRLCSSE